MEKTKTPRKITLTVRTVDHWRETRHYKTLKGARKFAHRVVGPHPDLGGGYVVSFYGDTVLVFDGASYNELFPAPVDPPRYDAGPLTEEEEAQHAVEYDAYDAAFAKLEASYPEAVYDRWASEVAASEPWWAA
jgi:hypothetical protein